MMDARLIRAGFPYKLVRPLRLICAGLVWLGRGLPYGGSVRSWMHTRDINSLDAEATMKRKRKTIVGLACGVLCAACVFAYLQSVRGEAETARAEALARYGGEQIEVCVARRDIAAGEKVDAAAVEAKLWVADLLPEDAIRSVSEVVGRTASSSILSGEVVAQKRFGESNVALDIPEGYAALSVSAKTVQAVGGALAPGVRVDMYATGDTSTAAIARDVLVLATSSSSSDASRSGDMTWVTVAVAPEEVQEIIAVSRKAEVYFALPASAEAHAADAGTQDGRGGDAQ